MKKTILFAAAVSLAANSFGQKTLPDLSLKTLEGQTVNARSIAQEGKITVISFWATWCAPCQKELTNVAAKYDDWQKNYAVEVVAVTIDNQQGLPKVKPLVAQKRWKYTIYSDANSQLLQQLGSQTVPFTVVVDAKGNIAYTHSGYKEGDEIELEKKLAELAAAK